MSQIKAIITQIDYIDNLHIVTFDFYGYSLKMMSLELGDDIKAGREVRLGIKPTHIAIAKDFSGIVSYANQLKATIQSIENGQLLTSLKLGLKGNAVLESIITLDSSKKMDLKTGDEVTVFIKASELSIMEVL